MPLTGNQFEQVNTAFLDSFDRALLRQMVRIELDVELNQVAGGQNDSEVTYNLIVWAIHNGRLLDLIDGAANKNPCNASLRQLAADAKTWNLTGTNVTHFQPIGTAPITVVLGDVGTLVDGNVDVSSGGDFVGGDRVARDKIAGDSVSVTAGYDAQFVAAGKDVQQTIYYIQPPKDERERRNRQAMLKLVNDTWVKGVLEKSLYNEVLIELGMEQAEDAVVNPWDRVIHIPEQEVRQLPDGMRIVDVFDDMNQSLLILGEPGSGKTTMLLELTREAIGRAQQDDTLPIPTVFNLSSWAEKKQPLETWLVDELNSKYGVPENFARNWVENDDLLLLLDGLDEVASDLRHECLKAVHLFRKSHLVAMAICSRTFEYTSLPIQLRLYGAVVLLPLSTEQIDNYLSSADGLVSVKALLRQDPTLAALAQTPLMLSIITLAYCGKTVEEIQELDGTDARRKHVLDAYIERVFAPTARTSTDLYSKYQTVRWLNWLAVRMVEDGQSVFLIEHIQPWRLHSNIKKPKFEWTDRHVVEFFLWFTLICGLIGGVIGGVILGTGVWMMVGQSDSLPSGLTDGLILGVLIGAASGSIYALYLMLTAGNRIDFVRPVEQLKWRGTSFRFLLVASLVSGIILGLIYGTIGALFLGRASGVTIGLAAGLLVWTITFLALGLIDGLGHVKIETRTKPNQGIFLSAKNGAVATLSVSLVTCAIFVLLVPLTIDGNTDLDRLIVESLSTGTSDWLFEALANGTSAGEFYGLFLGMILAVGSGLILGLVYGLEACFKHVFLRFILFRNNSAPWNLAKFLDYTSELALMRKVGGGYIFIHRILMEHFAEMTEAEIAKRFG